MTVLLVVAVIGCTFAAVGLSLTIAARSGSAGFVAAVAVFVTGGGLSAAAGADGWVGAGFSLLPTGSVSSPGSVLHRDGRTGGTHSQTVAVQVGPGR